jgi:hypothetical protein
MEVQFQAFTFRHSRWEDTIVESAWRSRPDSLPQQQQQPITVMTEAIGYLCQPEIFKCKNKTNSNIKFRVKSADFKRWKECKHIDIQRALWSHKHIYLSLQVLTGGERGSVVVKALRYIPERRGFETRQGERFLSIHLILAATLGPKVYSASNRNE